MKRLIFLAVFVIFQFVFPFSAGASSNPIYRKIVRFDVTAYLNTAVGWQYFSNDPITEVAGDGSYAGPLGEWLPGSVFGAPKPKPGDEYSEFFIPKVELDLTKHFGTRARLQADFQFGRLDSGTAFAAPGINLLHAYGAILLYEPSDVELWIGRLGVQSGFEPVEDYVNDTVSYSIIWRGLIVPPNITGIQLTGDINDHLSYYLALSNGVIYDTTKNFKTIPSMLATLIASWGPDAKQSSVVITPFIGPESHSNSHWTYGLDAYVMWWLNQEFQLNLEGSFQYDKGHGGPDTAYAATLLDLHWDFKRNWYVVGKYVFAMQSAPGNGVLNLTGAEQNIHEYTLCLGHYLTDTTKIKVEGRMDVIDPKLGRNQYVGGGAMSLNYSF